MSIWGTTDPYGRKERRTDRHADITKLTVAFGNYANAPKEKTG